ncbi:hypothetical protein KUV75_04075 [Qipengyuania gaetbuli]|uniref:hypothetical protein n=1 Tax=Qipengyuania gaetbuli TaxID=266952 RepID=UPI001C99CADC|nr:hypothetical protein [Qipengyuania gaetbuli]MBY6014078.1 hypothetical protein [Qipengyuania gaetbuli]
MLVGQALVAFLGIIILVWILTCIAQMLAELIRSALVAFLAAIAFQIFLTPDSLLPSILIGFLAFALTLHGGLKTRQKRSAEARRKALNTKPRVRGAPRPSTLPAVPVEPIEKTLNLPDGAALIAAWDKATELCPWDDFADVRESCARLLALARGEQAADFDLIECASFVRTQVPALIAETAKFCESCSREQKKDATRDLARQLRDIGAMAKDKHTQHINDVSDNLLIRRAHIAERLSSFSRKQK